MSLTKLNGACLVSDLWNALIGPTDQWRDGRWHVFYPVRYWIKPKSSVTDNAPPLSLKALPHIYSAIKT